VQEHFLGDRCSICEEICLRFLGVEKDGDNVLRLFWNDECEESEVSFMFSEKFLEYKMPRRREAFLLNILVANSLAWCQDRKEIIRDILLIAVSEAVLHKIQFGWRWKLSNDRSDGNLIVLVNSVDT